MKIMAMQYENDIEELQHKLQAIKMKMTAEIKVKYSVESSHFINLLPFLSLSLVESRRLETRQVRSLNSKQGNPGKTH